MPGMANNGKGFVNGIAAGAFGALGGICGKVSFDQELLKTLKPKVLAQVGKILPKSVALPALIPAWMGQILQFTGKKSHPKYFFFSLTILFCYCKSHFYSC